MKHKNTVGAFGIIINKEEKVLLCHRNDYDLWNLPGGGLEKRETPWDCVIREIKEETGLNTKISHLAGIYSNPNKDQLVFVFVCNIIKGKLTLNKEARDLKYFSLAKIPKNTIKEHIKGLHYYFNDKNKVHLKDNTSL